MFTMVLLVTGLPVTVGVQVMVYVEEVDAVTACDPDVSVDERPGPETVQLATPVELQAIVVVPPPVGTRGGVAEMLAPGAYTVTGLK